MSIYSLIRLKAAVSLSFLTSDQPTIEVVTYVTLHKLLTLCTKGIISPLQYHKHIHDLLVKIRGASLSYSTAKSLTLLALSFSSKVMLSQTITNPDNVAKSPDLLNKSIHKTLLCVIGETGSNEVSRILDMFYLNL